MHALSGATNTYQQQGLERRSPSSEKLNPMQL